MFLKKLKKSFLVLLLIFIMPTLVLAYSDYIIPGGENLGIEIHSKGIIIVGTYKIGELDPAYEAGLKEGDIIKKINNKKVENIDELVNEIASSNEQVKVSYERENQEAETILNIYLEDGVKKTGLYIKDSITGIGTLSYIDPETNIFGALGHEIIESNTGQILEIKDGKIVTSNVTDIEKSTRGVPGSKNASINYSEEKGQIKENTENGIFGYFTDEIPNKEKLKVALPKDIKLGSAKILTVIDNDKVEEYDINIIKINRDVNSNKSLLFEITDNMLLEKTGGIIQGMSGSPIIQNNQIIGAVTHVVVDDPKKGYGIFITNMLKEGEN